MLLVSVLHRQVTKFSKCSHVRQMCIDSCSLWGSGIQGQPVWVVLGCGP